MTNLLRVGLDYRPAMLSQAGTGRYARELVRGFCSLDDCPELELFAYAWKAPLFAGDLPKLKPVRLRRRKVPNRLLRVLYRYTNIGIEQFLGTIDLFHYTHFVFPPLKKTPFVTTIHDVAFLEDGFFPPAVAQRLRERTQWALEHSRFVITPSQFTADELITNFSVDPARVRVTLLGCDHVAFLAPVAQPKEKFILTVGTLEPRKNHLRILQAFEHLVAKGFTHQWVVAGSKGWMYEDFLRRLEGSPARSRIRLELAPSEERLLQLYAQADALVYVSLYEGFGLPPLEALTCGTPVVTSARASMPEVCGAAAVYVDPTSVDSIAEGMEKILTDEDLRASLKLLGQKQAALHTWQKTAEKTLQIYTEAVTKKIKSSV